LILSRNFSQGNANKTASILWLANPSHVGRHIN